MKRAVIVGVVALLAAYGILVELPTLLNWQRYCNNGYDLGTYAQAVRDIGRGDLNHWIAIYNMHPRSVQSRIRGRRSSDRFQSAQGTLLAPAKPSTW